jgi:hypothetical protein
MFMNLSILHLADSYWEVLEANITSNLKGRYHADRED